MTAPAAAPAPVDQVEVIAERIPGRMLRDPDTRVYHLPVGPTQNEGWWQPIACGGGIALHGHREIRPVSQVCPDCLAATAP